MVLFESGLSVAAVVIFLFIALGILFLVLKAIVVLLPGVAIAFVVWYLTRDLSLAGISFIAVTLLVIIARH
jgi:hypothetical protein